VEEWPEAVERVASVLRGAGLDARLEQFSTPTPTAADAARAVGCDPGQIVKSLVVLCDARPVVALVPGDRRADLGKVARAAGAERARVAGPVEVERLTGFQPGAVAPFPLPGVSVVLMEQLLLGRDVVWIGAGSPRHLAALSPSDLAKLSHARQADLIQDDA
jgi:prolyl-tRNA editing enzyme YbaK/EbsC (Cys-tRNA(Pro) deacylase)